MRMLAKIVKSLLTIVIYIVGIQKLLELTFMVLCFDMSMFLGILGIDILVYGYLFITIYLVVVGFGIIII